jgi:hypothetical protein
MAFNTQDCHDKRGNFVMPADEAMAEMDEQTLASFLAIKQADEALAAALNLQAEKKAALVECQAAVAAAQAAIPKRSFNQEWKDMRDTARREEAARRGVVL